MNDLNDFDWDDALLEATREDGKPRFRVYRPKEVTVVLGRGSRLEREVHVENVQRDGVPMLRRRGGGCAVVLDAGNIVVSCTLSLPGLGRNTEAFHSISSWMINALDKTGVKAVRQEGISDLALEDRKIGGACIYRAKDLLYYSTTLLFYPDLNLVEKYLLHPPREPEYRSGRTHRSFMGSLGDLLPSYDVASFTHEIDNLLSETVENFLTTTRFLDERFNNKSKTHEVKT